MIHVREMTVGLLQRTMGGYKDASPAGRRLRAWMMQRLPGQLVCVEFEDFVSDYHEGTLSLRERRVFDLHMQLCPMCRVYFASYLRTIELGRRICASDDEAAPAELPDELVSAILAARRAR